MRSSLIIVVSVDWEGESLNDKNLFSILDFRHRHPDVPLQHFLNPVYYTKNNMEHSLVTEKIRSVLRTDDEQGLHIHPRASLLKQANVQIRPKEQGFYCEDGDWLDEIFLDRYELSELCQIIEMGSKILLEAGFEKPISFRGGAWSADKDVLNALIVNGFKLDASGGNFDLVENLEGAPVFLSRNIKKLWPHIHNCSQPYRIDIAEKSIWEIPNNGCLADYMTADEMFQVFLDNRLSWEKDNSMSKFVSIGFHQEYAAATIHKISDCITKIKRMALRDSLPILFTAKPLSFLEGKVGSLGDVAVPN